MKVSIAEVGFFGLMVVIAGVATLLEGWIIL